MNHKCSWNITEKKKQSQILLICLMSFSLSSIILKHIFFLIHKIKLALILERIYYSLIVEAVKSECYI